MANAGIEIAPKLVPIRWISQSCPNRCYSQSIFKIQNNRNPQYVGFATNSLDQEYLAYVSPIR